MIPSSCTRACALASLFVLLAATTARAGIPGCSNCTCPTRIRIVAASTGSLDTLAGKFVVIARDPGNNPIEHAEIQVVLESCPDLWLAASGHSAGVEARCAVPLVLAFTNAQGVASFTIVGGSRRDAPGSSVGCAGLYMDGVKLGQATVAAFDLDGIGGVTVADAAVLGTDLGTHAYRQRSDFDGNGSLAAADLAVLAAVIGTHAQPRSGIACP